MAIVDIITANCENGKLSQGTIARRWDDKGTLIQFAGYPEPDDDEQLIYRLIVWMKTSEDAAPSELPPIELEADQWLVSNVYTQLAQTIRFQLCITNESGTYEKHSPIFAGNIGKSLSHNGEEADIDVSELFDPYKKYVDELVVAAGAVVIDEDLDTAGAAADAKATGDALAGLNGRLSQMGSGVPTSVRQALYNILNNVTFDDTTGYNNDISVIQSWASEVTGITVSPSTASISGSGAQQLTATTTPTGGTVVWTSSDPSIATVSSNGLVTGVNNGSCTITATSGDLSASCTVTVSGFATLSNISAVYSGGSVREGATLSDLVPDLVVTANYSDSTTATLTDSDYTLSGSLNAGTSTVTVSYGGKTTTFNVTVLAPVAGWLYRFNDSIVSDGTKDFGFGGTPEYGAGVNGNAYYYHVATEGSATNEVGIYNANVSEVPDLSGDFTISLWGKSFTQNRGMYFSAQKYISGSSTSDFGTLTTVATGWTCAKVNTTLKYKGIALRFIDSKLKFFIFAKNNDTYGKGVECTPPSSFDNTQWHHYAITRSGSTVYLFVDGEIICTWSGVDFPVYFPERVSLGSAFKEQTTAVIGTYNFSTMVDDLYIAETCKWSSAFDPSNITY